MLLTLAHLASLGVCPVPKGADHVADDILIWAFRLRKLTLADGAAIGPFLEAMFTLHQAGDL